MDRILIVSSNPRATAFFKELLSRIAYEGLEELTNGQAARRMLVDREFDLCIINAPLADEPREDLARRVAQEEFC